MLITNPFHITVTVSGSVADMRWELDDGTGQRLAWCGAYDCDPNWNGPGKPTASESYKIKGFVFVLPKSPIGILRISPVRQDKQGETFGLPALDVPVRFETATSILAVFVPKNFSQYQNEAGDACSTGSPSDFNPTAPFVQKHLTVLRVNDVIFASAEAAAESLPTQGPIRIVHFAVQDGTGYADVETGAGGGWAGVSIAICEVEAIIKRNLLQLPKIKNVVFAWPPPAAGLKPPATTPAQARRESTSRVPRESDMRFFPTRRWYDAG